MILTVDVGLKNLAMCAMSCSNKRDLSTYTIHLWDVYDTLHTAADDIPTCGGTQRNGNVCGKTSTFRHKVDGSLVHTCARHFPKHVVRNKTHNVPKRKLVKDFLLQDIARIVITKMDELFREHQHVFDQVAKVFIELQPKINNKMKLMSHVLYTKFVQHYIGKQGVVVRFVRASQKLKAYTGPPVQCTLKNAYSRRKYLAVQYTRWFLTTKFNGDQQREWLAWFDGCKKKDDCADTFLMNLNAQ